MSKCTTIPVQAVNIFLCNVSKINLNYTSFLAYYLIIDRSRYI